MSDSYVLLNADVVQGLGALAASFLVLSLFGVIRQAFLIVMLVRHHSPDPKDTLLVGGHQNFP